MSFCLYNTNELFNLLNHEIEMSILDKWAETHKLFFNQTYIWKPEDVDSFLYENFEFQKVLQIKTINSIPLNEKEKEEIVTSKDNYINNYQKYISTDEIIEIKKKKNIPITNQDCKDTIDKIKDDLYRNLEYENNLKSQNANSKSKENAIAVQYYKKSIKDNINTFENTQTYHLVKLSTHKHKTNKWLVAIFIISAISALIAIIL